MHLEAHVVDLIAVVAGVAASKSPDGKQSSSSQAANQPSCLIAFACDEAIVSSKEAPLATRGSFQKHQKEQARREKRQQKLARRQGRAPAGSPPSAESPSENQETNTEHPDESESSSVTVSDHPESVA